MTNSKLAMAAMKLLASTKGGDSGPGLIELPKYHNWNNETATQLGSFTGNSLDSGYTWAGQPVDPFTVFSTNPGGSWNRCIAGVPDNTPTKGDTIAVDLSGGTGATIDPSVDNIRVVILSKTRNTTQSYVTLGLSVGEGFTSNSVDWMFWAIQENLNPDSLSHARKIGGVTDFNEAYTGHGQNRTSGNQWRYFHLNQEKSGNTTWGCYDSAGNLVYQTTRAYQGSAGTFPPNLRYLTFRGVDGGNMEVAQIWVGTGALPSLPLSAASNLAP